MSAKDYERIWRETNAEVEASNIPNARRDIEWCHVFTRKLREARKEAAR